MRPFLLTISILLAAPLGAQTTLLSEDFSGGFPTGWTNVHHPGNTANGWFHTGTHMSHIGESHADNSLVTPGLDLQSMTEAYLHVESETEYAFWLGGHWSGQGGGHSTIEVSIDNGITWDILWSDQSENDDTYHFTLDLAPYLGQANVLIGFHYDGNHDHNWMIHKVVVDDEPLKALEFEIGGLGYINAGSWTSLIVKGARPNRAVKVAYSRTGNAPTLTRFGIANLTPPILQLGLAVANSNGVAVIRFTPPVASAGRTLHCQAVDWTTGTLSPPRSDLIH
ncbi:MAG: hypothetical protein ACPG31_07655 [Planctomycetota bacterium]